MHKHVSSVHNNLKSVSTILDYDEVNSCPICKKNIAPVYIASSIDSLTQATVFNFCRGCSNSFITKYGIFFNSGRSSSTTHYYEANNIFGSEPNHFSREVFDEKITSLSPQFDKIYNQALAAETMSLDEIAGLGYRKAMEFLIKDFAIHKNPENIDNIKRQPLAQCIRNYISSDDIKTLAERCAWIGNDEAHYIRIQEDRDVSDMKSFIKAMVYFIGMILITEDAASMIPRR